MKQILVAVLAKLADDPKEPEKPQPEPEPPFRPGDWPPHC